MLVAALLLLGGCTEDDGAWREPRTLSIGLLAPLSGPDAALGQQAAQGAQLAIDLIAVRQTDLSLPLAVTAGVRGGTPLTLAVADSHGDGDAAGTLIRDRGALGLIAADRAETVRSGTERAEALGVPLVDAGLAADALSALGYRRYFQIGPADRALARAVFGLLRQQRAAGLPVRRITVVESGGTGAAALLATIREISAAGAHDLTTVRYRDRPTEIETVSAQCLSVGTDVVIAMVTSQEEAAAAAQLAERLRGKIPVVALGQRATIGGVPAGRGVSEMRAVSWSVDYAGRSPVAEAIAERYNRQFGAPLTEAAASAFTATLVLANAVDSADRVDPDGVHVALQRTWFPAAETVMPWNGIRFDAAGQNELAAAVVEQQTSSGPRIVYPLELAVALPTWPSAKSSGRS